MTYIFEQPFEKRLKGIKKQFIRNIKDRCEELNSDFITHCKEIDKRAITAGHWSAVASAFSWARSIEGDKGNNVDNGVRYWSDFANKYKD